MSTKNNNSKKASSSSSPTKATSPNKLQLKCVQKVTPLTNKNRTKTPFPLYVQAAKEGVVVAFLSQPYDVNRQAFTGQIFTALRNQPETMESLNIWAILSRRAPIEQGYDVALPQNAFAGQTYYFRQFVRIHATPNQNTATTNRAWADAIIDFCNTFAAQHFQYPTQYAFAEDLTNWNKPLPPVNAYLVNRDVMQVMDMFFPPDATSRQEQADNLLDDYFGDDDKARNFVLAFPLPNTTNA